jgi:ribosome maturation protein Sdo1
MHKSVVLLVIGAAATLLVACGSPSAEVKDGQNTTVDLTGNTFTSEFGLRGPAGAAGPAGPPGAPGPNYSITRFGADQNSTTSWMPPFATPTPAPMAAMAAPRPPLEVKPNSGQPGSAPSQLDTLQRQVISVGSLSIEVTAVQAATSQVRAIAEGLGGFVEQLSSFGDAKNQQANLTIRVPQPQFFSAMERLEALGKVQNRNVGSEDVSSQFIDLKARLASAQREEQSLLSLLGKAANVTEILTIERELSRVRSEIERVQGQLNFLERRVELATISVSLVMPQKEVVQPPSAILRVEVDDVTSKLTEVRTLVASLNGKVDRELLSVQEDRARADVSMRVFAKDFDQAVQFLERLGKVKDKQLQRGQSPVGPDKAQAEEPDSYVQVSLVTPVKEKGDSGAWVWWVTGGTVGGVALVALLVTLVYRSGSRQRM